MPFFYNHTMTFAEMTAYIRLKTRTSSTTLTNADLLILYNVVKNNVCQRALEVDEDIFEVPTYMNLVSSATQREYPLSANLLSRISRVEAALDGTNYIKLEEIDLQDIHVPITTEANITKYFTNTEGEAFYDISRNAITIYSGTITAGTNTLRIWQNTWPADATDMTSSTDASVDPSTTTHGTPKALHMVICKGVIIEWKESKEKPIPLTERELKWEFDLQQAIMTMKKANYDRQVIGSVPTGTYNMRGEDGSNL